MWVRFKLCKYNCCKFLWSDELFETYLGDKSDTSCFDKGVRGVRTVSSKFCTVLDLALVFRSFGLVVISTLNKDVSEFKAEF